METVTTTARQQFPQPVYAGPAVTITLPFEPKMSKPGVISQAIEKAVENVEMELLRTHCDDMGMLVIQKLKLLVQHLNYNTYKKSITLFVSPVFEKVLYLDFEMENTISISGTFKVRDLLAARKLRKEYLVLFISDQEGHIYQVRGNSFIRIATNTPECFTSGLPKLAGGLPDPLSRKEQLGKIFLRNIDMALSSIVRFAHVPLIVVGPERTISQFKKLTQHGSLVVDYLPVEQVQVCGAKLRQIVGALSENWDKMREKYLLNRISIAAGIDRLVTGIQGVREQVMKGKGKLLLVEACFPSSADCNEGDGALYRAIGHYSKYSYIQDAVDEVIEKLLEGGAEIEIVRDGLLSEQQRIALIV